MNSNQSISKCSCPKCPCGREAATATEHPSACAAHQCAFCYDFDQYARMLCAASHAQEAARS